METSDIYSNTGLYDLSSLQKYLSSNSPESNDNLRSYLQHNHYKLNISPNVLSTTQNLLKKSVLKNSGMLGSYISNRSALSKKSQKISVRPKLHMLASIEKKVFQEVASLMGEVDEIKKQVQKEKERIEQLKAKQQQLIEISEKGIDKATKGECYWKIKREMGFDESKIQQVRTETQQITKKIKYYQIINGSSIAQLWKKQLKRSKEIKEKNYALKIDYDEFHKKNQIFKKENYQIQQLKASYIKEKQKIRESSQIHDNNLPQQIFMNRQLLGTLKKRLQLEQYILEEQEEKEKFYDELVEFKDKMKMVQKQNKRLKALIKERGLEKAQK